MTFTSKLNGLLILLQSEATISSDWRVALCTNLSVAEVTVGDTSAEPWDVPCVACPEVEVLDSGVVMTVGGCRLFRWFLLVLRQLLIALLCRWILWLLQRVLLQMYR